MLIDSNLVSIDCKPIAAITGDAVDLANLKKPGRHDVPVCVKVIEAAAGGTSVTVKLQQGDTATGSFADVASKTVVLADLKKGADIGWKTIPKEVTKPWIKVVTTVSGTFTGGKLFAAVVREEEQPYEAGLYINGGVVKA